MSEIRFLTLSEIIGLHRYGILRYSPNESMETRDSSLLESAISNPQQTFEGEYLYVSMAEMAAAYLVGLSRNHPFVNGNKRIAFMACSVFLRMNGFQLNLSEEEVYELTLRVVKEHIDVQETASIIEDRIIVM